MTKEHPHAEFLRAIASGGLDVLKEFECLRLGWTNSDWSTAKLYANQIIHEPDLWQVRRKPRMIQIGEQTVQAGITEAPGSKTWVWLAEPGRENFCYDYPWANTAPDILRLKRGLIHLSHEPAVAMGRALAALTEHKT